VRWDDVPPGEHVVRQQGVVGDHHIRLAGAGPGQLGEALRPIRALHRADALARRGGDRAPRRVVDARIQLVAVAGVALHRPLADPDDLLAQLARLTQPPGALEERVLRLVLLRVLQFGQTNIVVPALEQGESGLAAEHRGDRPAQAGKVMIYQLGLQRQRRGGDHHRAVDGEGGSQVGQRLARAGARLDQQMPPVSHRLDDRRGHRHLARPGVTARNRGDRGGEKLSCVGHGPDIIWLVRQRAV
jgi:hypothetical protein